jgi:hypothetical protein
VIVDERPQGESTRQLFVGENLDASKLEADYDWGVLTLRIPVTEESKPRTVRIGSQGRQSIETGSARQNQPTPEEADDGKADSRQQHRNGERQPPGGHDGQQLR